MLRWSAGPGGTGEAVGDEREQLWRFLTGGRPDEELFAPAAVERIGLRRLAAIRQELRAEYGEVGAVTAEGPAGKYRVECERGAVAASVNVDAEGLILAVWVGGGRPERPRSVRERWTPLLVLPVTVLPGPALAAVAALAGTRADVVQLGVAGGALGLIGWLVSSGIGRWALVLTIGALLAVAALRMPGLPDGSVELWMTVLAGGSLVAAVRAVVASFEKAGEERPVLIRNPLPGSRALILQGGGPSVNHHAGHPDERFALDLLCLGPFGTRARGLAPRANEAYHAYGAVVAAPCDGEVLACFDGYADQPVLASASEPGPLMVQPPAGNHIVLRAADRGAVILLAHLRPGSLRVRQGERVSAGQELAEVGNSGNTTEPHLHIQANVDTARGRISVPMRLAHRPTRPLRRGVRLDR
ncbi:peptidase M23-like protein [Kitasatospora viridis]|uniref:Peptidase M23-like protein n=1 Tax=Kitasatospora viridis TaxID=281105 RepID=A0A561UBV4_9ACTN|nr:peptidase M23-like protein [Kitasatospora viridis]